MRRQVIALLILIAGCTSPVPPTASPSTLPTSSPSPAPTSPPTPAPTATPTLAPTPGATATASPLATPPRSTVVKIVEHLTALADIATQHQNNRASGTVGYDASADYVADQLVALGYEVTRQAVDFTFFREVAPVSLTVGDEAWTGIEWLHALLYAPSGDVEGRLQPVGIVNGTPTETSGCDPNDWDEFTSGRIALVFGGVCRRRDVVELAQSFGAAALISMYPRGVRTRPSSRRSSIRLALTYPPSPWAGSRPKRCWRRWSRVSTFVCQSRWK